MGTNPDKIYKESKTVISSDGKKGKIPEFWDDGVSKRVVEVISKI